MNERLKRKKIFYVPGMISLVFIPLVFIVYFYKTNAFEVYRAINLNMPNKGDFEMYKVATLRKYKVYNFNGSGFTEKKKLNEMKFYLRKLRNDKDTINGIKIHYGSKTHYDVFIRSLDILVIEGTPTWGIYGNDIYILGSSNAPRKVKNDGLTYTMNCGTGELMRQQSYWEQKNKEEEEARIFQVSFFKQKWLLLSLGYLGLVLLNILVLVKFNKTR